MGLLQEIVNLESPPAGVSIMTRGNQRDLAREKAAKKDKGKQKAANDQDANKGMTKEQRMARDAERMREKQAKKAAEAAAGTSGGGGAKK